MKKNLLLIFAFLLVGCATTIKPVPLNASFWDKKQEVIGVAATKAPKADASMTGTQGLLDYAINRGNAKSLITHLEKMDIPKLDSISTEFAAQLQARGFNVKKIEEPIDTAKLGKFSGKSDSKQFAEFDYNSFKKDGITQLIVISVDRVGTTRNYYAFAPTGPPQAELALKGQLIDLNSNELLWYNSDTNTMPIAEPWDQQPGFENVTSAVKTNVDQGIEKLEQSFFSGPVQ